MAENITFPTKWLLHELPRKVGQPDGEKDQQGFVKIPQGRIDKYLANTSIGQCQRYRE